MDREAWNSRQMTTRVLDRCDECGNLKDDVKTREYFTGYALGRRCDAKITSCTACFELVKQKQAAEYS
jgi:hypothetical protein